MATGPRGRSPRLAAKLVATARFRVVFLGLLPPLLLLGYARTEPPVCESPNIVGTAIIDSNDLLECLKRMRDGSSGTPDFNCDGILDPFDLFVFQQSWHEVTGLAPCVGDIEINDQWGVDALAGCSLIDGDLTIGPSTDDLDLRLLRYLDRITGDLIIVQNENLSSLDGLQGLTRIGGDLKIGNSVIESFYINGEFLGQYYITGDRLTSLNGLQGLLEVGGNVELGGFTEWTEEYLGLGGWAYYEWTYSNPALLSLSGLENLERVGGSLILSGNEEGNLRSLTSLGLNNLETIGRSLIIRGSPFTSLKGLQSLTKLGSELEVVNNEALASIEGLEGITGGLNKSLRLTGNGNLTSIHGLSGITRIDGQLEIRDNDALKSLEGLENLSSIGKVVRSPWSLRIENNDTLADISALRNVSHLAADLWIIGNPSLDCSLFDLPFTPVSTGNLVNCATLCASCCPPKVIRSEDDVSSFAGCAFAGDLTIGPTETDFLLTPLNSLEVVRGNFVIHNTALTDLDGLQNLREVQGNISIYSNGSLNSLNGLQGLRRISGAMTVQDNPGLLTLEGLENLSEVGGILWILGNQALTDISSLENLTNVGAWTSIQGNTSLDCSAFSLPFFPLDQSIENLVNCPTD